MKIQVDKIENFEDFVKNMEVNTYYELPKNYKYKWIKIEKAEEYDSKETYFMWVMEFNYSVAGYVGYIFPLAGGNQVTHFKTEAGAKRNIIKRYKDYFDNLEVEA